MSQSRVGAGGLAAWILAWLASTIVSIGMLIEHRTARVDPDEIYWIGSAYYYHLAFERWDWTHRDWQLLSARENPQVSRYVMGLGLALSGQHIVTRDMLGCFRVMFRESSGTWGAEDIIAKRVADAGRMNAELCARPLGGPGVRNKPALLVLSRRVMLFTMVLASLMVFVLGASIANRATGFIASQLLLVHPIAAFAYNHAMSDAVAVLFSTTAAMTTWLFVRRFLHAEPVNARSGAGLASLNGAALALACGAKMNSLIMVFLFGACVGVIGILALRHNDRARAVQAASYGAVSLVIAFAVFVLINPAILADFPGALVALFEEQRVGLEYTMRVMPDIRLATFWDKVGAVTHVANGPLTFALAAIVMLAAAVRSGRRGVWLVAAWWLIAVVIVTVWIPIAWARYVLPIVVPSAILLAYAAVAAAQAIFRFARAGRAEASAP
jgi:hypothetical protein